MASIEPPAPLCLIDDLPDGGARGFDPLHEGRDTLFIVRRGAALFGWRNACPHHPGARMAARKDSFLTADRGQILCAAHGARFEIDTGLCVFGPCIGQRLTRVALRVTGGAVHLAEAFAPARPRPGAKPKPGPV